MPPRKNLRELSRAFFRELFRAQKSALDGGFLCPRKLPRELFRAQKSSLGSFLGYKKVP